MLCPQKTKATITKKDFPALLLRRLMLHKWGNKNPNHFFINTEVMDLMSHLKGGQLRYTTWGPCQKVYKDLAAISSVCGEVSIYK